ncbi:MAG: type II toxin-antitoxin system death-on-curing family toxin [Caulobacteraceae bacterium]
MTVRTWLGAKVARAVHERSLALHGGAGGERDSGLLLSALARPLQLDADGDNPDPFDLAAAYTSNVVKNHPFVDGNKRTGFVLGVLFLELNDHEFRADEASATEAVLALATVTLDDAGYAAFLRDNVVAR